MWLHFREFIRAKRNKPFPFIVNSVGLSFAFAALIVMYTYVWAELNHDKDVIERTDIVLLKNAEWGITPQPIGPWLADNLPEVKQYCRIVPVQKSLFIPCQTGNEEFQSAETILFADSTYPDFFSLQILEGELKNCLDTKEQVILSESMAQKLFGSGNPLGKYLIVGEQQRVTVTAIFKDIENPGLRSPGIIMNLDYLEGDFGGESWFSSNWETYLKLVPGADRDNLTRKYRQLYAFKLKSLGWEDGEIQSYIECAKFLNYEDIYFTEQVDYCQHGNRTNINVLILIAILVLSVSVINYVNMATARVADKARVIGVKRILGAGRDILIGSVMIDAFLTCFLSVLLAWGIVESLFPFLSEWMGLGGKLRISFWSGILLFGVIPLGCGWLCGLFPALYLTHLRRLDGLNLRRNEGKTLQHIKGGLMILQFAVSIGLIITTLLIHKQMNFMIQMDPGYDRKNVVVVKGNGEGFSSNKLAEFRNLLLQNPLILKVGGAKAPIYNIREMGDHLQIPGTSERMGGFVTWIDEYFMDMMGLVLVEGEGFRPGGNNWGKFIINQRMMEEIRSASPGHVYLSQCQIGVVKDFNFKSMHEEIAPMYFGYLQGYADAYIRISPENREGALAYIEKCYKQILPQRFYRYSFMEDDYARLYGAENLFARRLLTFTGMSVIIACLGLLSFVIFFIEQKTKSISVRKVMGATEIQIMSLLNRDFIRRLLIAFVIACPVVYYAVSLWLEDFAYKITMSGWVFILAFVIMGIIALVCVSALTWKAATANPVDALKNE